MTLYTMMFGCNRWHNLKKATAIPGAAFILVMMVGLALPSHAAIDPLKRGLQLYKKHHYEDAIQLLYKQLPASKPEQQGKTYLALGMICLANAALYQDLYQASTATNLDYLNRLLSAKGPAQSRLVHLYLGKTHLAAGRFSEAANFFNKFIGSENGKHRDKDLAKIGLATATYLQNKPAEAHALWAQIKTDSPELSISLAAASLPLFL